MKKLLSIIGILGVVGLGASAFAYEPQYLEVVGTAGSLAMSFAMTSDGTIDFGSHEFSIDIDNLSISTPAEVQTFSNTGNVAISIGTKATYSGPWTTSTTGPTGIGINLACTQIDPSTCLIGYPGGTWHPGNCLQPDSYDMRVSNLAPASSVDYVFRLIYPTLGSSMVTETITYYFMAVEYTP